MLNSADNGGRWESVRVEGDQTEANVLPSAVCPQHGSDLLSKRADNPKVAEASRGRSLTEGNSVSSQQLSGGKRVRKRLTLTHVLRISRILHVNLKEGRANHFTLAAMY